MADKAQRPPTAAEVEIASAVGEAEPVPLPRPAGQGELEDCPIQPLGHLKRSIYLLDASGQLLSLQLRDLTPTGLLYIFGGKVDFLAKRFEARDRKGNVMVGEFNAGSAARWLIAQCDQRGLWNPHTVIRGVGVWPDGESLIVHAGNMVMRGAQWWRPGIKVGNAVYAAAPPVARPSMQPASLRDGVEVVGMLHEWSFRARGRMQTKLGAPHLFAGVVALSMLGAAPSWRVHGLVTGMEGAGKSALMDFVSALLGAGAFETNDFSEAGLRQTLSDTAGTLLLDEGESRDRGGFDRIGAVIEMVRKMSGDKGLKSQRGGQDGVAQGFSMAGNAFLFAIDPPSFEPQDRSRWLTFDLDPIRDPLRQAQVKENIAWAARMSPALRARMIARWREFRAMVPLYREAFVGIGMNARTADLFCHVLAAHAALCMDGIVSLQKAREDVTDLADWVVSAIEDAGDTGSQRCLTHLVTSAVLPWRGGDMPTIGRLVADAVHGDYKKSAREQLASHGVRVEPVKPSAWPDSAGEWQPALLIANDHQGLQRIFQGTHWSGGRWTTALRRIVGAGAHFTSENFSGRKSRCTRVPLAELDIDPDGPPAPPEEPV